MFYRQSKTRGSFVASTSNHVQASFFALLFVGDRLFFLCGKTGQAARTNQYTGCFRQPDPHFKPIRSLMIICSFVFNRKRIEARGIDLLREGKAERFFG